MFSVQVVYNLEHGLLPGEMIEEEVGTRDGSGAGFGERDLEWIVDSRVEAYELRTRIEAVQLPEGVTIRTYVNEMDD